MSRIKDHRLCGLKHFPLCCGCFAYVYVCAPHALRLGDMKISELLELEFQNAVSTIWVLEIKLRFPKLISPATHLWFKQ